MTPQPANNYYNYYNYCNDGLWYKAHLTGDNDDGDSWLDAEEENEAAAAEPPPRKQPRTVQPAAGRRKSWLDEFEQDIFSLLAAGFDDFEAIKTGIAWRTDVTGGCTRDLGNDDLVHWKDGKHPDSMRPHVVGIHEM